MKKVRKALLIAAAALPLCGAVDQPVRVEGGMVAGSTGTDKSIAVFRGIPFAAPPVGGLRWRAPQPVLPWAGVKNATEFSASCIQALTPKGFGPWTHEFVTQNNVSEDCLYLNVWTPAKSAQDSLPVFMWIYGGGFQSGSAEVPIYDGEGLARRGIVVVTINYRVGILGFLAHPELTKESGYKASGNYGLLDQIAALRWIRRNIAAFGGDPRRVTIAGQSAGSMSVHDLVASPLAKGLFHGAIEESGGSSLDTHSAVPVVTPRGLREAEADGVKFAAAKGASSLAGLRAMSWQELMKPVPGGSGMAAMLRFSPIVDGYVLPESALRAMLGGKLNDVPTMTGCNLGEISGTILGPAPDVTADKFRQQARSRFGDKAQEFLKLYPAATDEQARASQTRSTRDEALTGMYLWAQKRGATAKTAAYIYLWDHTMPGPNEALYGAFHTSEVPYVFDSLQTSDRPFTEVDKKIAAMMSDYWANFTRTGDPNGRGLARWPAVDARRQVMEVGDRNAPVPLASDPAAVAFFEREITRNADPAP